MPTTSGFIFQRTNPWQIGRKRVPIGPCSLSEVGATANDVFIQPDATALPCPVVRIPATRVHRPARVLRVRPPWPCPQTAAGRIENDRPPSDFDGFRKCALASLVFHSASGTRLRADGSSSFHRFSCPRSLCQFVWTGRKTQPARSVPAHPTYRWCPSGQRAPLHERTESPVTTEPYGPSRPAPLGGLPDETPPRPISALPPSRTARTGRRNHGRKIHFCPARPRRQTPSHPGRNSRRRGERTRAVRPAHRSPDRVPRLHGARTQTLTQPSAAPTP